MYKHRILITKPNTKFRHEFKHSINRIDELALSSRLSKIFKHDKFSDEKGTYRVSSLYFDTPYDKALKQKIHGVNEREKFRIRYYNDDLSFIRLEKKFKIGGISSKHKAKITKEEVEMILNGNIEFMLEKKKPIFLELYSKMKGQLLEPKTVVTYDREAFVFEPGNVRVTLDKHVRSGMKNVKDFLNLELAHIKVNDDLTVLEVKYDEFLPDIVRLAVALPNRRAAANSKYAAARKYE